MKKGYIIGGVAVLGAIALIAWYRKPKKNSDGFYNFQGKSGNCAHCEKGGVYYGAKNGSCGGGRCVANKA